MAKFITPQGKVVIRDSEVVKHRGLDNQASCRRVRDMVMLKMAEAGWTMKEVSIACRIAEKTVWRRVNLLREELIKVNAPHSPVLSPDFIWARRKNRSVLEIKEATAAYYVMLIEMGFSTKDIGKVFQIDKRTAINWINKRLGDSG